MTTETALLQEEILKLMKFNDELQEEKLMLSKNGRSEIE